MNHPLPALLLATLLATAGCAPLPPALTQAPAGDLQLGAARTHPDRHVGQRVRWGGNVVSLETEGGISRLEIEDLRLSKSGLPYSYGRSHGTFLARIDGGLDPAFYGPGAQVTVVGVLGTPRRDALGRRPYTLPVVRVSEYFLWVPDRAIAYGDPAQGPPSRCDEHAGTYRNHPEFHPVRDYLFRYSELCPFFVPGRYYGPANHRLRLIESARVP